MEVLLIGMPNVGKSVIFNKLTGINTGIANYAGTTVEFVFGKMRTRAGDVKIIDVPGTYSLNAANEAEKVALKMLDANPDAVICVLDANNLESSIFLLLQLMQKGLPVAAVVNRIDIIEDKKSRIDTQRLSEILNIDVIPMVATKGVGIQELRNEIEKLIASKDEVRISELQADWSTAENITSSIIYSESHSPSVKKKRLEELIVSPFPGIFIALLVLLVTFGLVIGLGMSLRRFLLLPFFHGLIFPAIISAVEFFLNEGFLRNILIGEYGFLIKGIEWPLSLVLPYVFSFYLALSILEDSGYLPRLGILLDGVLNKIGLSGANIIPIILGYGCTIPAIAATRAMNTKKERLIVVMMVSLSVPCVSQTGGFIALLAERSVLIVVVLFIFSLMAAALSGYLSNLLLKGAKKPITIVEVPVLLHPDLSILGKKIWVRIKSYLTGGAVTMFYAIIVTSFLYELGFFEILGRLMSPVVESWLRMPREASVPLILGVIRRELAILPLLEMELTSLQLFVGSVVGLFYVPCIAVVAMLTKEFGVKVAVVVFLVTIIVSFLIGGIIAAGGTFLRF